ncbi:MAG: excinuclease ABC subunit UvrC [Nitrospinaceae bacterium]|nr:excinuclease ABC subunit UvrC [Nitrospinaceae bacterium]
MSAQDVKPDSEMAKPSPEQDLPEQDSMEQVRPEKVVATIDRAVIKRLPEKPGIYIFKNSEGDVLYIGKAVRLRSRVRSYFGKSTGRGPWIEKMVREVSVIEHVVTATELEALILENNYIKRHKPRHNLLLRDDKHFPYLKLSVNEDYPRLSIVRSPAGDGAEYLGPFPASGRLRRTIRFLHKTFNIRPCTGGIEDKTAKRCIYFQMGQCLGPCDGLQTKEGYDAKIADALDFLKGKNTELEAKLKREMADHAEAMRYEKAAKVRDQIRAIDVVFEKQEMVTPLGGDQDILGLHRKDDRAYFRLFFVRGGRLLGDQVFTLSFKSELDDSEAVSAFIKQYYMGQSYFPAEVLLSATPPDAEVIARWLTERRGRKVDVLIPRRGSKRRLVDMACENAIQALVQGEERLSKDQATLEAVRLALGLDDLPHRIEAFDISNLHGHQIVGASVTFQAGRSLKDGYRRYRVRSVVGEADDFAAMREIVSRRCERIVNEGGEMPDLILIDGGKGQLSSAAAALEAVGIADVGLCSISKGRTADNPDDQDVFFLPGVSEPIRMKEGSPEKLLLQRIRDEVHRFAVTYHRSRRAKEDLRSGLDDVPGLGPKRRRNLLRVFGSLRGVLEASDEQLLEVEGVTPRLLSAIREHLGGREQDGAPAGEESTQ